MTKREIRSWLMDMDGVLMHEEQAIPGADQFIARLRELGRPFLVLTNNSIYTPRDLAARLRTSGLDVPEGSIWTSALATARFLENQRPGGSAFVIGEAGLTTALHEAGYTLTDRGPDYVVLGRHERTASSASPGLSASSIAARASSPPTPMRPVPPSMDRCRPRVRSLPSSPPQPAAIPTTSASPIR
jgi:ribonucleotide monophosphatase NagD (HAD superfamily)